MPPTTDAIRRAAAAAAREFNGGQVILFGSQARGTAGPRSDVDLLVLTREDGPTPDGRRRRLTRLGPESEIVRLLGGTPVHVLLLTPDEAEDARGRPGIAAGSAVEQGVTVHREPGIRPFQTGAKYWLTPEGLMVRKTKFRPDEAERLGRMADAYMETAANWRRKEPAYACIELQKAGEHSLKALITAEGRHIEHTHDLNALWEDAEDAGIQIAAERNEDALKHLSRYAGELEYGPEPEEQPAEKTIEETFASISGVVEQRRRELPRRIRDTTARLAGIEQRAVGTSGPIEAGKPGPEGPPTAAHPRTGEPVELRPATRRTSGSGAAATCRPSPERRRRTPDPPRGGRPRNRRTGPAPKR